MEAIPVLTVEHLSISFPATPSPIAVDDLSFSLSAGKTLAIVGESGSGKTLTALALMGLLPTTARTTGAINLYTGNTHYSFKGKETPEAWYPIRGKVASMVFQEPMGALNPVMKVGRQLAESISAHSRTSSSEAKQKALEWLGRVQFSDPEAIYHRYPHQLSGGQKQRVMIAMAMSSQPTILIADEPTTALDITGQKDIVLLMQHLQAEMGTAMIFITHDLALASHFADDILVMHGGNMVEYGPAQAILEAPQHAYTKALIACRPGLEAKGHRLPIISDFLNPEEGPRTNVPILESKITKEPILQIKNLRIWFPDETDFFGTPTHFNRAVEDVTFTMMKGEVMGMVGESGSGKSTITRALMGLQSVESGKILFDGRDLAHLGSSGWSQVRRQIQMIFQDPYASLNPRITIGDAIREPMLAHKIIPRKEVAAEARRLINLVRLPESALDRYPHQFSGSQLQRIGIARALALRPKLLICDESVSSLDVSVQAQILNLLKDLRAEFNLSYLFISHDLALVHYIADRVIVMRAGKIIEAGTAEAVLKSPQQDYTRRLVAAIP